MWVEQTKQGKYKYIERYKCPLTGKYKRASVVLDKNTRQAQKQAQEALTLKIQHIYEYTEEPVSLTLSDLIEKYRKEQKKTVKQSTYKRNYHACETLKRILGADTLLSGLNAGYIRSAFLATGKDHSTLNEHLVRLKALIRWGYRNDYIPDITFLDKLERFSDKPHREKIEDKFLEADQVSELLEAMEEKHWKILTKFLVLSGLRFGEAAALNRSDLDFSQRVIHVRENYDSNNKVVTTPKTRTSIRDVYMQDELYRLCRQLVAESISRTIISISSNNLIFVGADGDRINFFAYNKYLKGIAENILHRNVTPHMLRHTHASLMLESGIDVDSIARRLGHSDSKVTKEIYLHITKKLQDKENEKIKGIKIL